MPGINLWPSHIYTCPCALACGTLVHRNTYKHAHRKFLGWIPAELSDLRQTQQGLEFSSALTHVGICCFQLIALGWDASEPRCVQD